MAVGDASIRYLNLDRIEKEAKSAKKFMKWGCVLVCFFGIGILGSLFKINDENKKFTGNDILSSSDVKLTEEEKAMLAPYLEKKETNPLYMSCILLIPSAIPILISRKKFREIASARRYETIFGSDTDGIITADELSTQLKRPSSKIFAELKDLFVKGYFQNCSLGKEGDTCVKIDNALGNEVLGTGFVEVTCKNCGATNRIRADSHGKCSYCGNPLYGKIQEE
ncbi:MAG: hypothetical protein IJJ66_03735 [Treponema sp.]|nr:hypothetical protein [Treponema sp.]MBR0475909.1 hypothetical protein [Treponema sp.]